MTGFAGLRFHWAIVMNADLVSVRIMTEWLYWFQELHDSLPSDPAEADLLKMAEAVADASDDADCAPSSAKKSLYHIA